MSEQGDMQEAGGQEGQGAECALPRPNTATREVKATSAGFALALASVQGLHGPLSADEATTFRSSIARARAAAEARRAPSPQLDLDQAA